MKILKIIALGLFGMVCSLATLFFYQTFANQNSDFQVQTNAASFIAKKVSSQNPSPQFDFSLAAEKSMPAVVHIKSIMKAQNYGNGERNPFYDFFGDDFPQMQPKNQPKGQSAGSGVIISKDGYIVTNNHVVENSEEIEVVLYDKRTFKAKLVGTDPSTDLAVLQISAQNLPNIIFANSDAVKVGQWVLAVGNPFNLESTVTAGIVSAKGRNINILKDNYAIESFIQTDAAVNPGNSGGALVNLDGDLIGINTAIASPNGAFAGYSFAIPSEIVRKITEDIVKYGNAQRGFLGVTIRSVDGALAKEKNLNVNEGVYVDSLVENGSAKASGLKKGDVITKVDEAEVKTGPMLQEQIGRHRPGETVKVQINRQGKILNYEVLLKNKDGNKELIKRDDSDILGRLGIELQDLTEKEKKTLGLSYGVKVSKINKGIVSKYTDMQEGIILLQNYDKPIKNIADFRAQLQTKKGGILLKGIYPGDPEERFFGFGI